jgi:hypothetical protein
MLFGWLWQTFSPETAFGFSASCAILAAVLLKFWVPTQSGPQLASHRKDKLF